MTQATYAHKYTPEAAAFLAAEWPTHRIVHDTAGITIATGPATTVAVVEDGAPDCLGVIAELMGLPDTCRACPGQWPADSMVWLFDTP